MKNNKYLQGYVCAVACLLNSHGSYIEAKDLLSNIGNMSAADMKKQGVDEQDIKTLLDNDLIN
jgi:hypothetical protein